MVLAQIFTNDASALLTERLSRDISKASASSFDKRDNPVRYRFGAAQSVRRDISFRAWVGSLDRASLPDLCDGANCVDIFPVL